VCRWSGNRTNRRSGAFNTADDDAYTYVSGPTDIIDRVTSGGTAKEMSNTFKGELSSVNDPNLIQFTFDYDSRVTATEDAFLGSVAHYNTPMGDRYAKKSPCNARMTYFRYRPDAETGTSPFINFLDAYGTCAEEYPREQRTYVYLEGRPIAIAHATLASSGASAPTAGATYWLHSDHLGTPVLVTNASRVERWRWENDPFGRSKPVEYTVSSQDVSPDDDGSSGSPSVYKTCCCTTCGVSGCGLGTASCAAGCCAGASSQAVVWTKTYAPSGANNVRLHFSQFNVAPGATRTSKDYVRLENGASTVVGTLTGDLGDFWGPWSGDGTQVLKLYADNTADGTRGVVVDQLEYTTSTNGRYVMHLRMPGQIWDEEVQHAYNFHRWYRAEDGRYVSPDPIGLAGGEAGYFGYVGGRPLVDTDAAGLTVGSGVTRCTGRGCGVTRLGGGTIEEKPIKGRVCRVYCSGGGEDGGNIFPQPCAVDIFIADPFIREYNTSRNGICDRVERWGADWVVRRTREGSGAGFLVDPLNPNSLTQAPCHVKSAMTCLCAETGSGTCRAGLSLD
jgi:RHS repeat-associated protein